MSEVAADTVKPFSLDWNPVYESMPVEQDQVGTVVSSISNTLDPLSIYDALEANVVISKFKISVGATSIVEPEEPDDLYSSEEPWHVTIDISSLDTMVNDLESEVSAAAGRTKDVTPKRLSIQLISRQPREPLI